MTRELPLFILNPCAGNGRLAQKWRKKWIPIAQKYWPHIDEYWTDGPRSAEHITRAALVSGRKTIIAVGGDGTLNEVLNGFFTGGKLSTPDAILGHIPCGSGGDFARTLKLPRKPEAAFQMIAAGNARRIDIGKAVFDDARYPTRHFINICSTGVVAEIVRHVNELPRFLPAMARYFIATVLGFQDYSTQNAIVRWEGRELTLPLSTLLTANGKYFGRGLCPTPRAHPSDGLFEILLYADGNLGHFLRFLPDLYRGKTRVDARVQRFCTNNIRIEPIVPSVATEADGEIIGAGALNLTVLHQIISFLAPASSQ